MKRILLFLGLSIGLMATSANETNANPLPRGLHVARVHHPKRLRHHHHIVHRATAAKIKSLR